MNLGETCLLKRHDLVTVWRMKLLLCCYHCDCMQQHYDVTHFEYVLWRHTMHDWVMNIHYKTWIAQGRFINIILTPSKQWGVCDNIGNHASQWRRNKSHGLSNHRHLDCLANRLFRPISMKTSKLPVTGLCEGNPVAGWFPSQRASYATLCEGTLYPVMANVDVMSQHVSLSCLTFWVCAEYRFAMHFLWESKSDHGH